MKISDVLKEKLDIKKYKDVPRYGDEILSEPKVNTDALSDALLFIYSANDELISFIELDEDIAVIDAWRIDVELNDHQMGELNQWDAYSGTSLAYFLDKKQENKLLNVKTYHQGQKYIAFEILIEPSDDELEKQEKNNENPQNNKKETGQNQ